MTPASTRGTWFDQRFRSATARYSLYCFPFAGGVAAYYSDWAERFRGAVELVPVQLPGRGPRMFEPPPSAIEEVADEVAAEISAASNPPVLFGHSMGAILAFEVARRLEALGRPAIHLVVSGRPAPPQHRPLTPVSGLPREEFVQVLRDYGAASDEILAHNELLDLLIPMIRADFAMIESYRYQPGPSLSCPISAWCGSHDPEVDPSAMQGWAAETTAGLNLFVRPGGHFFLCEHVDEIARAVHDTVSRLERAVERDQAATLAGFEHRRTEDRMLLSHRRPTSPPDSVASPAYHHHVDVDVVP